MSTTTKSKGLIFDGESIRAFLAGRKTQTRRVVNPQPPCFVSLCRSLGNHSEFFAEDAEQGEMLYDIKPAHAPGDIVYAKESWAVYSAEEGTASAIYRADYHGINPSWNSPMFMPRWAARLWFRVVEVRVQRLQDISEADAIAEGADRRFVVEAADFISGKKIDFDEITNHRNGFRSRWDTLNGEKHPWSSNPWVWAYTLERIEP